MIKLSRYLAIFLGIITPLLETVRRWSTWQQNPAAFFDDYIIGGLLLYGAWRVGRDARGGQKFLPAAGDLLSNDLFQLFLAARAKQAGLGRPGADLGRLGPLIKGIGFILIITVL